ncbi:FadR/GntR family transcriptional regulator [Vibrio alfacsensis]|uniref:FadR family transcriptional regulator n=1 Tax=Vibrio alfacsensis TaxID=1074311 RepID=A0ABN5PF57_9VIBR|nr:FadR/GntR family transcriptional regulator [Vibrio alfacsensis]AXY00761.1 FadR family transcriptional regulator [Vibrio alfacsensis]BBM64346.1 GntR family transcriptional regulator [Vibrio alfacsensis]BCN24501.1 GntR family transcriptional regulator [Vibrio alfacsensis]
MSGEFHSISGSKRSLHVQVAREIARGILSGKLPQGSILPGEMALCEQFGISRTALREAVKLLTSKGLLESRPKVGTRVINRAYWNFLDPQLIEWMDGLADTDQFCSQFLGLRRAIEPEACALAAIHATADQRIELSETFQQMVEISEADVFDQERWMTVDIRFHSLIFNATGNDFYLPFGNILTTMFINFIAHSSEEGSTCIKEHRQIYDAIMAGNADKARQASANHLLDSKHRLAVVN